MFSVYVIQLPWNYSPRIMAFSTREKAEEVCDALNREGGCSGSSNILKVQEMSVYEDEDVKLLNESL